MLQLAPGTLAGPPTAGGDPDRLDLPRLLRLCRAQRGLIGAVLASSIALGIVAATLVPPRYTAELLLLVDPRRNPVTARADAVGDRQPDTGLVESQAEILRSEAVAKAAVRASGLATDGDFLAPRGWRRWLGTGSPDGPASTERAATERVLAATRVRRLGATQVIRIEVIDGDAARAARTADALAEAYMVGEIEARGRIARRSAAWLEGRLRELHEQVSTADLAVQTFKARHAIVDTARGLMSAQQLGDVNAQLVAASATTAETRARLDRVLAVSGGGLTEPAILQTSEPGGAVGNGQGSGTVAEALRSEVVTRLRAQYLDLATREAELAGRYGAGGEHGAVVALRAQMAQIARSGREELQRLAEAARSDHAIALAREDSLRRSLDRLVSQNAAAGQAQVDLRNLESAANSLRLLQETVLRRHEEAANEETFPLAGARVIAPASVPARPSSPGFSVILAASAALGLAAGIAAVLLRAWLVGRRGPATVEALTGLPCFGTLPGFASRLRPPRRAADPDRLGDGDAFARLALEAPDAPVARTLRAVVTGLGDGPLILGIAPLIPGPGQARVAANLALLLAASGRRTLLVDAGGGLTQALMPEAKAGLADVLEGQCTPGEALRRDATTGLDVLPAGGLGVDLAAPDVAAFLAAGRAAYAYLVVDLPAFPDAAQARAAAGLVDHVVLTADAASDREAVRAALPAVEPLRLRAVGVLLSAASAVPAKSRTRDSLIPYGAALPAR